ncbi:ABC transporter ATP-binding protein [Streptomyces sp. NPDC048196]|uniref:ABC transporter ATP-binding protein n=1 Tax=Streptomyces sp. NPDC048196 TaxID=3154712 RepID=UPI0033FE3F0E
MLIRLAWSHLRPYVRPMALLVLLQLAQTVATLCLPALNADVIDKGVVKGDVTYVLRVGAVMTAVTLLQVACLLGATFLGARISAAVGRDLRAAVFGRVQSFAGVELHRFGAASLLTRTTNDVQQVQTLVLMALTLMVSAPVMCVGGIAMALRQDPPLSALLLLVVPVLGVVVVLILRLMQPLFRGLQNHIDQVNQVLREQITGIRVIRAFVRDRYERERFTRTNTGLRDISLSAGRLMSLMSPAVMLVINSAGIAVVWYGGHRIDQGHLQIGALTAFLSYLAQILMSVMMATVMFMIMPRAAVCAERIDEVLSTDSSVVSPLAPVTELHGRGRLELAGVEFRYSGAQEPVLKGISLVVRPGEVTAVVGSTGSGKSTLLGLAGGLFDATSGTVRINGVDIRQLDSSARSAAVSIVLQKPYLFSGTVASNLRYGRPDATDQELWHALEIAQARDFVEAMEEGLETSIAQGGSNVSGGQRQRLAIARALVRNPEIYLFDDSFSALDYTTDAHLRAALAREIGDATVLIVAQRVSTIRNADRIVVLNEGRIVGDGPHSALMESNETYREIVLSQLTEREAA